MQTPPQLSREAIEEFGAIYEEEFDQKLSDDEVRGMALRLLRFFGILMKDQTSDTPVETALPQPLL